MLPFPTSSSREEKLMVAEEITNRILAKHGGDILAIGVYGSIGQQTDGPYSDLEMFVISRDGVELPGREFVYDNYKIEVSANQKAAILEQAQKVDDSWPIRAGMFTNILTLFDPEHFFDLLKALPMSVSDEAIKNTMREFMVWEPYETMAKIRNNRQSGNFSYLTMGAYDFTWQTAKLIGLANKRYYSTRAKTFEESLRMPSKPAGYEELTQQIIKGELSDKQQLYELCEALWTGLNEWFGQLEIDYRYTELPY